MQAVINLALPFFALIFTGYLAASARMLSEHTVGGLNTFVFYFALPALLLIEIYQAPAASGDLGALIAGYYLPGIALFFTALLIARRFIGLRLADASIQALAAVFSNVGFIGLPLVILLFGSEAALPAVAIVMGDTIVMLGLATALIEADLGDPRALSALAWRIAAGVVKNPIVMAGVVGLTLNLTDVPVADPLIRYGGLLADAAGPCALFALGATLAGRPISQGAGETAWICLLKLIVHPALVAVALIGVFDLPPVWIAVGILQAALPVAANVYVLAQRYQLRPAQASTGIFFSTALGIITLSLLIGWLYPL
ncbi:AEC family transporter [Spiribacter aquaticus]|uniref:AEC family transporter n=1 Tax=Spiribacter aquaticus TaxID=1935996 RepID=A0A557RJN4_9GAMM|nr:MULTISPECIES: AEC family transporter [Spiribacter]KAF0280111.1 malonate transporter [Spiribacter roseus]TVO65360.1 AEC family transporter [Spiribacter aquaticus]